MRRLAPILVVAVALLFTTTAFAQFTTLKFFGSTVNGLNPFASPITDGTYLYGATAQGGANDGGVFYRVKMDGSGYTVIHSCSDAEGRYPLGRLLLEGGVLYGTTYIGGANGQGTIFKMNPDGSSYETLLHFNSSLTGGNPAGGVYSDGTYLYGMTSSGGTSGFGTVYKIKKDGSDFTKFIEFNSADGRYPNGEFISDGTFLYGMTLQGGNYGRGNIFRVKPDGNDFGTIFHFDNSNGAYPLGALYFDGTDLWGLTQQGGSTGRGVLFRVATDGNNYNMISDFPAAADAGRYPMGSLISDGTYLYGTTADYGSSVAGKVFRVKMADPTLEPISEIVGYSITTYGTGTLVLSGSTLYGTSPGGGYSSQGSIYKVDTNGSNEEVLYSHHYEGYNPTGKIVSDGTDIYGITQSGGLYNYGTIYKISPDGVTYTVLFDFDGPINGASPTGDLLLNGGFLYGMAGGGAANNMGAIFKIRTDGTGYTKLLDLDANTGSYPESGLAFDGTYLYGTAFSGGTTGNGTLFKIKTDGNGFEKILDLDYNTSGGSPMTTPLLEDGFLWVTTYQGGVDGSGIAFKIKTDGSAFQKLVEFGNSLGANPQGTMYSDGTYLYGLTPNAGLNGFGGIYRIKKDGSESKQLFDFDGDNTGGGAISSFISDGTWLYATTTWGGEFGNGTIFKIKPDGSEFIKLEDMVDGSYAEGMLYSDGSFLYGVTTQGGTLFKRSFAPFTAITSFAPTHGMVGTYVVIKGHDFNTVPSNNEVRFNGLLAKVISSTPNIIVAMVPDGTTDGKITVANAGTSDTSTDNFVVDNENEMFRGTLQTCDAFFTEPHTSDYDDVIQTFVPGTAGGKIHVSFGDLNVGDELIVYDGPDTTYPVLADIGEDYTGEIEFTSSAPGGELTFRWIWEDEGTDFEADVDCIFSGTAITIDTQPGDVTSCGGLTVKFATSASGPSDITYQWQFSDDGNVWSDIADGNGYSNTATAELSVAVTSTFGEGLYRARVNGFSTAEVTTDEAELIYTGNDIPDAPTANNSNALCAPATVTVTASGGTAGNYRWYADATGGQAINGQVNASFTTPSLTATTTYYASLVAGVCESNRTPVLANIKSCAPPLIATTQSSGAIGGTVTIDLSTLITDPDNDVDLTSLKIAQQPQSGAVATLNGTILTINYSGNAFAGTDVISIEVCDTSGLCATQDLDINIAGDLVVYNAVSPNGDDKNEFFMLEYIDVLPTTKDNVVKIFNRWGDEVFAVTNYNNRDRVFNGVNKNGNKLPSGTYYYKISFPSGGAKDLTGYLELKY